ncbi:MAG TPA: DUF5666 domain-containing protein [Bryobacteraceae bacterium]|jgi:hypothetical protein|nr:DUF5666 domain-containing protein [Bryobacteraceae bacterium]
MTKLYPILFILCALASNGASQTAAVPPVKPTEHVLGTIVSMDAATHSVVVKDDKSGAEQTVLLADTKTLLKVPPGAKDLKTATRITPDELAVGDRVDVRGFKSAEDAAKIAARSVVLMSGRDLQQAHAAQAAEWQHSTAGVVTGIDASKGTVNINERSTEGPKQSVIQTSPQTEFTRYSPENPGAPARSELSQIEVGDHVRVIGDANPDGSTITARKLYSGAFRVLNGTIVSLAPDGKQLVIRDLASKKPMTITLNDQSAIHRLPPELAARLSRRAGAGARSGAPPANGGPGPGAGAPAGEGPGSGGRPGMGQGMHSGQGGDISGMIERLPKISLADLKPGDAVVVSGVLAGTGDTELVASNVIAGVEPILQTSSAARGRGGDSAGGDWGLGEMSTPQ